LPKALTVELRRLPWRLLGASLVGFAIACWLALISWSYGDPSPSYATLAQPHNWLGRRGASVADALMQSFGLAAPFLVLPLAALGIRIAGGRLPLRPRLRAIYWVLALLAVPGFFAMFPVPARWLLDGGLGGIVGDFIAARVAKLSSFLPRAALWPGFGLFFFVAGAWCVFRACGLTPKMLSIALHGEPAGNAAPSKFEAAAEPHGATTLAGKVTSWVTRLSPRDHALTVVGPARDSWLTKVRIEPRLTPARAEEPRKRDVGSPKPVRTGAPSPFADWGSRPAPAVLAADELDALTVPSDLGSLQTAEPQSEPEKETFQDVRTEVFEDIRIEPFFGPRRGGSNTAGAEGAGGQDPETSSPLRRFTGNAIESARNGARRIFKNGAEAVKRRKPLIYVKNGGMAPEVVDEENFAPSLPPITLLTPPPRASAKLNAHDPALMGRASALMSVLGDFGVKGRISGIYPGPVITLFELEPARGTKSSRVVGLADDIARSMSAVSARVAVVPGRDAIGIELPNPKREIVSLRAIIESNAFQDTQAALPLALGKSIGGEPIVVDLARMPHLLIAGTTGSGKSVGINTMILSLLYRLPPSQCNFIMIDPKMLELSVYDRIPHLLAPVVTDPKKAVAALKWTVKEMNTRYELMSKLGVRNITSYNQKVATAQLRGQKLRRVVQTGFDPHTEEPIEEEETFDPVSMTYIVVVIDEMADLMMVAGKDIEYAVQRLSQMARAAGIHLIMATQRPSVDVVTGTIKANFPSRISFQVTSKIDSRTIIGEQGAEQLLGQGDMLYMASGGRIIRAHGPFVSDDDVEAVAGHLKAQGYPSYRDDILEDADNIDDNTSPRGESGGSDLYHQAVEIVLKDRKPTTSYLQRRLGIGYNRAASLIERMEQEGIIGAPSRTGRREILLDAGQ
jgi:S-DNA-T family DNA segregation ATPase FtsK/SpoIIIE